MLRSEWTLADRDTLRQWADAPLGDLQGVDTLLAGNGAQWASAPLADLQGVDTLLSLKHVCER